MSKFTPKDEKEWLNQCFYEVFGQIKAPRFGEKKGESFHK